MAEDRSPEEVVREVFVATDEKDTPAKLALLADDVTLTFGNSETVQGIAEFEKISEQFNESISAVRHEIKNFWSIPEGDQDVALAELLVHYTRLDGANLTLPCFNTFRIRDGLITDYQIYMDINPVFA